LTSLDGLDGLDSIGSNIYIAYNDSLESISGLHGLTSVGGYINASDNLSLCSSFVEDFFALMRAAGWGGSSESYRNASC
jgi:hypothetical protein